MTVRWLIHRGLGPANAIASSSVGTFVIAGASALTYLFIPWLQGAESLIDMWIVIYIALPATLIAPFGAIIAHRIKADNLRKIFAIFLFMVAFKLTFYS